jgi:hypothetical protein
VNFSVRLPGLSHFPPLTHDWELGSQPADILTMVRMIDDLGFGSLRLPRRASLCRGVGAGAVHGR